MFRNQFLLAFKKKNVWFTLLFLFLFCIGYYCFLADLALKQTDAAHIAAPQSAFILSQDSGQLIPVYLEMLFPFLALLPFSFSYLNDRKLGISDIYISNSGIRKYYVTKQLVCFSVTFIVFFIPFLINLIQVYLTFPADGSYVSEMSMWETAYDHLLMTSEADNGSVLCTLFLRLLRHHPFLYDLIYTAFYSAYAGLVGMFSLSVSYFLKPKLQLLLFLPYLLLSHTAENFLPCILTYVSPGGVIAGFNEHALFGIWILLLAAVILILNIKKIRSDQLK